MATGSTGDHKAWVTWEGKNMRIKKVQIVYHISIQVFCIYGADRWPATCASWFQHIPSIRGSWQHPDYMKHRRCLQLVILEAGKHLATAGFWCQTRLVYMAAHILRGITFYSNLHLHYGDMYILHSRLHWHLPCIYCTSFTLHNTFTSHNMTKYNIHTHTYTMHHNTI